MDGWMDEGIRRKNLESRGGAKEGMERQEKETETKAKEKGR